MNRRRFLSFLAVSPVAVPVVAVGAAEAIPERVIGILESGTLIIGPDHSFSAADIVANRDELQKLVTYTIERKSADAVEAYRRDSRLRAEKLTRGLHEAGFRSWRVVPQVQMGPLMPDPRTV